MHGWAEVEHDLIYKPFSGELSEDEHAILDEINGLVLAGEIALERLQQAVKRRVEQSGKRFNDQYELAAFLDSHLQSNQPNISIRLGRVDLLLLTVNNNRIYWLFICAVFTSSRGGRC
jgi:hypothetical protein